MRRIVTTCLTLVAAALLVLPAAAVAAPKKGPAPQITRVQPMRISVGGLLTIRGRHFKAARTKNTIIFRSSDGRTAFVKPRRATSRKLVLRIPASVARLLKVSNSRQQPTRLKLRVLAGKFSKYTPKRLSPVVTGAGSGDGPGGGGGGDGGGVLQVCDTDADHDNDLLSNSDELKYGTDPCLADTDNDQMTDGWEYWSAKDLNLKALPYPGKRPFPNPLDPSDGGAPGARFSNIDFDGDGLSTLEEYRAWRYTGSGPGLASALGYSDGTKSSRLDDAPAGPAAIALHSPFGEWTDDERDADSDGLANFIESVHGPGQPSWWEGYYASEAHKAEPWGPKLATTCGQEFGAFTQRPFAELDMADPDVDGDTVLDGVDDQDNDDYTNIQEMYEPVVPGMDSDGATFTCDARAYPALDMNPDPVVVDPWGVNAFNPCAPNPDSRTCAFWKPFK